MANSEPPAGQSPGRFRRNLTFTEKYLWALLRDRRLAGVKFRRQVRLGRYVADFVCFSARLVIEADGGIHKLKEGSDAVRDEWLKSDGFTVLRFANETILTWPDRVLAEILAAARARRC